MEANPCDPHAVARHVRGAPGHAELAALGVHVGRKRVARLMRALGLAGVSRRKGTRTTVLIAMRARARSRRPRLRGRAAGSPLGRGHHVHPDVGRLPLPRRRARCVEPAASSAGPMATHLRTELVARGAQHGPGAAPTHGGDPSLRPGLPVHVDRLRTALPRHGRAPVMGSVGDAYDNPSVRASSPRSSASLLDRHRFQTQAEARMANLRIHRGVYNPHRRHSALDTSPHQLREEPVAPELIAQAINRPPNRGSPSGDTAVRVW